MQKKEERLQKVIAASGYTSRRKAEELIKAGKVKVNGEVCDVLGTKVTSHDEVEVEGNVISKPEKVYFAFYKPKNVVCTMHDQYDRRCVADFFEDVPQRVFPVGRLDYDTTGLLFMTNDGEFANLMMHPSSHIEKIYEVSIEGILTPQEQKQLEKGIYLNGVKTLPAYINILRVDEEHGTTVLQIRIFEGKNHQVKNMFEAVGHPVKRLQRQMIGDIDLKRLRAGQYRRLTVHEVRVLRNMALEKKRSR